MYEPVNDVVNSVVWCVGARYGTCSHFAADGSGFQSSGNRWTVGADAAVLAHYIVAVVTANVFCSFQLCWFIR